MQASPGVFLPWALLPSSVYLRAEAVGSDGDRCGRSWALAVRGGVPRTVATATPPAATLRNRRRPSMFLSFSDMVNLSRWRAGLHRLPVLPKSYLFTEKGMVPINAGGLFPPRGIFAPCLDVQIPMSKTLSHVDPALLAERADAIADAARELAAFGWGPGPHRRGRPRTGALWGDARHEQQLLDAHRRRACRHHHLGTRQGTPRPRRHHGRRHGRQGRRLGQPAFGGG